MNAPRLLHAPTDLATDTTAERFDGHQFDADVSFFINHTEPGRTISQHRHPYPEVFVIHDGEATFTVDDRTIAAQTGAVLVVPAHTWHGFTNTGDRPLEMTSIHPVAEMQTEPRPAS